MDIYNVLSFIAGLCLFLLGMENMGKALARRADGKLGRALHKMTANKAMGLITGMAVTAVIQSSSAATVMVVGLVNSGLMNLKQAAHVIMGANIGTTVTAWILSLSGIGVSHSMFNILCAILLLPLSERLERLSYRLIPDRRMGKGAFF